MDQQVLEQRFALCEAYNMALLKAVQTLIALHPNQPVARAAVADAMEQLIASALPRGEHDAVLEVLQGLQQQLPPPPPWPAAADAPLPPRPARRRDA